MKTLRKYVSNQLKLFLTPNHILLNVEIATNRLLLKPISTAYKEDIFREFNEEVTTYMYPRPPKEICEIESFIIDSIAGMKNEDCLGLVVLKKDTKEFLGCAGVHNIGHKHPELGIWLKKSAHGNSYGLESITALRKWSEQTLNHEYLIYPVDKENIPSRKIPEKLGGTIAREFDKTNLSGKVLHIVEFRIPKGYTLGKIC